MKKNKTTLRKELDIGRQHQTEIVKRSIQDFIYKVSLSDELSAANDEFEATSSLGIT